MSNPFRREFWEGLAKEAWIGLGNPAPTKTDQNFDSFRHAYTSAFWAFNFGEYIARQGGDYIERSNPTNYNGTEYMLRDMRGDLLNNEKGREIGLTHPGGSQPSLAERVRDALNSGELVIDKQTDSRTLSTNFPLNLYPLSGGGGGPEGDPHSGMPWPGTVISPTVGTTPDPLVKTIVYVDPLVLDLDGDGLEITPLSQGVLFDANGDALKTGTAWVGGDDGLLVWDRNGNGTIDTGAELFGDETLLANGEKAPHGFAALSELDTGSLVDEITVGAGDGVFDAQDAQYNTLRIWRDLNQDGISQANELQTLAQSGVRGINLASRADNTNYGDAILAQSGSFTRTDGSTGQAGSFILAQNNFAREFVPITVSDAAKALLDLKGSGWVRDLREAGRVCDWRELRGTTISYCTF